MCYTIIILLSYPISVSDVVTEFHQRQKRVSKPSSAHFGPIRNDPESDKFNQYYGYFLIFKNSYLQKYYLYHIIAQCEYYQEDLNIEQKHFMSVI